MAWQHQQLNTRPIRVGKCHSYGLCTGSIWFVMMEFQVQVQLTSARASASDICNMIQHFEKLA